MIPLFVMLALFSPVALSSVASECHALIRLVDSPGLTAYEMARTWDLFRVRSENRHFEQALEEAHDLFPDDPQKRSVYLRKRLAGNGGDRIVPVDEEGRPAFLSSSFQRTIDVEFSPELNTAIFRSKKWSAQEADIIILVLHGQGGIPSHSRSAFQPFQILSQLADLNLTSPHHAAVELRQSFPPNYSFPKIHLIAVDQPGHGTGPRADAYMQIDSYLDWLERVILHVREPNKPLDILARSASPPLVRELIARRERRRLPPLIRSLSEVGPVYPNPSEREHDLHTFIEEALTATSPIDREVNWPGWVMARNLILQTTWLSNPSPHLPVLTEVGIQDGVVSAAARDQFRALSGLNPLSQYVEVPGRHDPLFLPDRRRRGGHSFQAYVEIVRFLERVRTSP